MLFLERVLFSLACILCWGALAVGGSGFPCPKGKGSTSPAMGSSSFGCSCASWMGWMGYSEPLLPHIYIESIVLFPCISKVTHPLSFVRVKSSESAEEAGDCHV